MEPSDAKDSPPGQWAGGRTLTNVQRERKREADRKRINRRREQAADKIASLESKLQLVTAELEALKKGQATAVNIVADVYHPVLDSRSNTASESSGDIWASATFDDPCITSLSQPFVEDHAASMSSLSSEMALTVNSHMFEPSQTVLNMAPNNDLTIRIAPGTDPATNCQDIFSRAIGRARNLSARDVCTDFERNQDALIRGIVNDWSNDEPHSRLLCPLWRILRNLDRRIFGFSDMMTRFCALRMIHSLLLCVVGAHPFTELPTWYRPRPAQYKFPHALAIDILPWPGLRERGVLFQDLTASNKFWTNVVYYFRFNCPGPSTSSRGMEDVFTLDPITNRYAFTGLFMNSLSDLRKWTMNMGFFESFPETYDDIVPALELGKPLFASVDRSDHLGSVSSGRECQPQPLPLPDLSGQAFEDEEDYRDSLSWRQSSPGHLLMLAPVVSVQ